jgi:hypothetical protein
MLIKPNKIVIVDIIFGKNPGPILDTVPKSSW